MSRPTPRLLASLTRRSTQRAAGVAALLLVHAPGVWAATDAHGEGGSPDRGLMPDITASYFWWEMVWTIVVFLIFFGVLSVAVWPKILKALQDREEKQRKDLLAAERAAKDAEKTLGEYKTQLAAAQKEAQRIVDESRTAAQQVAASVKADAEREITQLKERTQREIAAAKESALADIYEQSAVLSTQIAGRILKRELNPQDQQALVTESLQQLQRENN